MANFVLSTYEESTPTPSPSPTPSATPTPTPITPKKVIVLHGMGGSWNKDALINCKSSGYSGAWSLWSIANWNVYQGLLDSLQATGYEPIPFTYDWRRPIPENAQLLRSFIQSRIQEQETVHLVGHSMGGLVARSYLELTTDNSHLEKLLTVGSPHLGSVLTYPLWSAGDMWIDDPMIRTGYALMQIFCARKRLLNPRQTVQTMMPSVQNVLPTFDYLQNPDTSLKPVSSMNAKNNWLPTSFVPPFYGVTVGSLAGIGRDTLEVIGVRSPTRSDERSGNWSDGRPNGSRGMGDGDGTVLRSSASLPGTDPITLPLDHTGLVADTIGVNAILSFLNDSPIEQAPNLRSVQAGSRHTSVLVIVMEGAHGVLKDKQGNEYADADGQITIVDPHDEPYTLSVRPLATWWWNMKYRVTVVRLFDDGTHKWKEYDREDLFGKKFKLHFDRKGKKDNILEDR